MEDFHGASFPEPRPINHDRHEIRLSPREIPALSSPTSGLHLAHRSQATGAIPIGSFPLTYPTRA
jgi:hypothetical protein